jgi:hypothetical protein
MDFQKDSIHKNYDVDAATLVHQKDLHHPRLSLWVPKFTGDNHSGTSGDDVHCAPDVSARNPQLGTGFQQHSNGYSNSKIKSADRWVSRPSEFEVSCPRCLIAGHLCYACKNPVCCLSCGHSGHYAHNCSARTKRHLLRPTRPNSLPSILACGYKGNLVWRLKGASTSPPLPSSSQPSSSNSPSPPPSMVNFSVDPHLHVPVGFLLYDVPRDEPHHRPHVFLRITMDRSFENVAITHFFPHVVKEDFQPMERAL